MPSAFDMEGEHYADQNLVALSGVVVEGPRFIAGARAILRFALSVRCRRPGLTGLETMNITVAAYGPLAERASAFLCKGARVGVLGCIDVRSYRDESGQTRKIQEVVASEVLPSFGSDWGRGQDHLTTKGLENLAILAHPDKVS